MEVSGRSLVSILFAAALLACAGTRPTDIGVHGAALAPCPASPNCVSSDAADAAHQVPALELAVPAPEAWRVVREEIARLSRTKVVTETADYLHVECTSALFRFVDDLELHLRADRGSISVRSASRLGHGDMGVNRARVETLRDLLAEKGVVR